MCAEHRLEVITEIKKRLLHDEPCRVVSTQLVEAGVDVDFPLLYRALAPLDSIVQAAGRCNREGKADFGRVKVFAPAQPTLPPGLYQVATEVTSALLPRYGADRLAVKAEIFGDYFSRIYQLTATGADIEAARRELKFRDVAQAVKVIEDAGTGVVVPFGGDEGPALKTVRQLRGKNAKAQRLLFGREDLRRLQRFMVNLKPNDYDKLLAKGQLQPLIPNQKLDLQVVDVASYHKQLGVLVNDFPTDEWTGGM
jgi:CRISPR-associated endonuclease/helicase Cas3